MLALAKSRGTLTEQRVQGDAGMGGESVASSSLYLSNPTPTHEELPSETTKETLVVLEIVDSLSDVVTQSCARNHHIPSCKVVSL